MSVYPSFDQSQRNIDASRTQCLQIKPCAAFCLAQRYNCCGGNCCGTGGSISYDGGGSAVDDNHGAKLTFTTCHCCGSAQVGDAVTLTGRGNNAADLSGTVTTISAGSITITFTNGLILTLSGFNGNLCSVNDGTHTYNVIRHDNSCGAACNVATPSCSVDCVCSC